MRGRLILLIVLVFALSACDHPEEAATISVPFDTAIQIKVFGNAPRYKTWTAGSFWNNWSCCSRTIKEAALRGLSDLGYNADSFEVAQLVTIGETRRKSSFTLVSFKEKK